MSTFGDLSNLLSNCTQAMYNSEPMSYEDLPAPPIPDLSLEMTDTASWSQMLPQFWNEEQVLEWISYHVEKDKWDASDIDFSCCKMDGQRLCQLSCQELLSMFGPLGDKLYNHLCELTNYWDLLLYELFPSTMLQFDIPPNDYSPPSNSDGELQTYNDYLSEPPFPHPYPFNLSPGSPSAASCNSSLTSDSPRSAHFYGSFSDLTSADSKSNLTTDSSQDFDECNLKQQKRKRGRPRKISKENRDSLDSKKGKHAARGSHLWEFIRDILIHPELNEGLMKWEDRSEGVFKFLRSEAVAQLWGQQKKNTSMTYEKLSRAMRYYYKREILERVDGRRLVYKFGKNSNGWKEEEAQALSCRS